MGDFSEKQKTFINNLFQQLNVTINETVTELRKEITKQIEPLKSEINDIKSNFEEKFSKITAENKELIKRTIDLERKLRKNYIVVSGLKNSDVDAESKVTDLFKNVLEINIDKTDIKELYNLGNRKSGGSKTVLISFTTYEKKLQILRNSHKLKRESVYISNDQCWEDRQVKKKLLQYRKQFRDKGETAFIKNNKLVISNKFYTVEQLDSLDTEKYRKKGDLEHLESDIIAVEDTEKVHEKQGDKEDEQRKLRSKEVPSISTNERKVTTRSHLKK